MCVYKGVHWCLRIFTSTHISINTYIHQEKYIKDVRFCWLRKEAACAAVCPDSTLAYLDTNSPTYMPTAWIASACPNSTLTYLNTNSPT